jgi:amino acid transporter/mannitol/fructose-specific phosphotransferase system IIA component (Ntr-type)
MAKKLKRDLGLLDVFCIASGAMISSGLFILPGIASAKVGPALFLSYLIATILALPAMFSMAELVTAMPKAGGDYFFISRSMGSAIGTIGGLASWFSLSLKSAFALIGMGAYVKLITNIPIELIAVFLCILFVAINIGGVKQAGRFQVGLVLALFIILFFYITKGFSAIHISRYTPFTPFGASKILTGAGFVFISYGGLTKIASVAEEVRKPGKNIPLGMILALVLVGLLYGLVVFVTTGVIDADKLHYSLIPISRGANEFMGSPGVVLMSIAALLAFISTANAGILSASRYPMALSRDNLLPKFFKKINNRFKTPHLSIIITGAFMIVAILFLELEVLVRTASLLLILMYILVNLALIIMRESKILNYQPKFKAPLYPWLQVLGIIGGVFLILEMGFIPFLITILFVVGGYGWYLIYGRLRIKKEFALIHVIERITAKELSHHFLGRELREIIRERDNIVEDRFDKLIKESQILDIEKQIEMEEFFRQAADALSKQLDINSKKLLDLFIKRERESSTVIRPGLAIPHIVIEGQGKFKILLARAKKGILFPLTPDPINTVFVLVGTKDERNFHLRALAAIAQIAQDINFEKNWMVARSKEDLRDIILLAERKRFKEK